MGASPGFHFSVCRVNRLCYPLFIQIITALVQSFSSLIAGGGAHTGFHVSVSHWGIINKACYSTLLLTLKKKTATITQGCSSLISVGALQGLISAWSLIRALCFNYSTTTLLPLRTLKTPIRQGCSSMISVWKLTGFQ